MNSRESTENETQSEDAVLQTIDSIRAKSLIVQENSNFQKDSKFEKVPEHYCNKVIPLKYYENKIYGSCDPHSLGHHFFGQLEKKVVQFLSDCYLSKRRFENFQDHKQRKEIINNHYDEMQQRLKEISQRFAARAESDGDAKACLLDESDERQNE